MVRWGADPGAALAAALGFAFATTVPGQASDVVCEAVIAHSGVRGLVPAYSWWCEQWLPAQLPSAAPVDGRRALCVRLSGSGLQVAASTVAPPDDAVAAGSCRFADGPPLHWICGADGVEDWFVPPGFRLPRSWQAILELLDLDALDTPRSLSFPVLAAHLAGAALEGEPRAALLRLGASQCGDATWVAWQSATGLRVRGRSEGGLMLPAMLLALAAVDGVGAPRALPLRAFAARDGDRTEAARQLGRTDRPIDLATLHALLRGEDDLRLTAIDALRRHGAVAELPRIVAAAAPERPWAELAAIDALRTWWPTASAAVRQQTRAALQRSGSLALRSLDVEALTPAPPPAHAALPASPAWRTLFWLGLLATGLFGLWHRERTGAARGGS